MRKYLLILILALPIACALGACGQSKLTAEEFTVPRSLDELKKAIVAILTRYHMPGVGIALVTKDNVIWAGGLGKADLASGREVDSDTMFRVGSITKSFIALSLLQLQEKGKISLETPVRDLASEVPIRNPWESTDPVRVVNLLEHTAGFDDFPLAEFYAFDGDENIPLLTTLRQFPAPQNVRWRPGTFASYSNPDYGVAGYILEKVTHRSCDDYLAANILRPLGMMRSNIRLTSEIKATLATGYEYDPPRPVPYFPILLRSAGDLKSSPNEMARFVRMILNRGSLDGVTIVSPESIARMEETKTTLGSRNGLKNGYGLGNYADVGHAFVAHGHNGGLDGFGSNYEYIPEQGVGFFFSINSSASTEAERDLTDVLFAYITRRLTPPSKPSRAPFDQRIEEAIGLYQFTTPRSGWTRFLTEFITGWTYIDNRVLLRRGFLLGRPEKLVYLGNGQIRTDKESAATGVYCKGSDGETYACGPLSAFQLVNPVWPVVRLALALVILLTMATSILFAFVWFPRKLLGRMREVRHLSVRIFPLVAVLSFALTYWWIQNQPTIVLARPDSVTISLFVMSIVFPVLSVAALILVLVSWRHQINRAARIHSLFVAIACCTTACFFAYWGMLGARTWTL
jgi:CubicO group peptidase (beta-lactamase class C family)